LDSEGVRNVTGLDMIRRDWCELTRCISDFVLDVFFHEPNHELALKKIATELKRLAGMVRNNGLPSEPVPPGLKAELRVDDFIIRKAISKPPDE
jgi:DNA polymerase alpha subunit A